MDVQVLPTVPLMFSYRARPEHGLDLARFLNDHIGRRVEAHPGRFVGGPERIALGSDYPFPLGEPHPGWLIESAGLDAPTMARLLHGTALEWLGLPNTAFA